MWEGRALCIRFPDGRRLERDLAENIFFHPSMLVSNINFPSIFSSRFFNISVWSVGIPFSFAGAFFLCIFFERRGKHKMKLIILITIVACLAVGANAVTTAQLLAAGKCQPFDGQPRSCASFMVGSWSQVWTV